MNFSFPEDPIYKSLYIGVLFFVMTFVYLTYSRPDFVMMIDKDNKQKRNWISILLFSILIQVATSICVFFMI